MVNVVIRRDLPTGKGERPSSHTPKPEDDNRGRGRSPGIRPGKNPTNEDSSRTLTHPPGKEKRLAQVQSTPVSVREEGGEVEGDSKGFRSTATTEEGTLGRTRPTASPSTGKTALGETSHPQIQSWCAT